jgi:hypothetical protein
MGHSGNSQKYPELMNRFLSKEEYAESKIHPIMEKKIK